MRTRLARATWRFLNPAVIALAPRYRIWSLLETTGHQSGRPRTVPVATTLEGDTFWVVAMHGLRAAYVANLLKQPEVRVRIGRRWREGRARLLPPGTPVPRACGWYPKLGLALVAVQPRIIRIDLHT